MIIRFFRTKKVLLLFLTCFFLLSVSVSAQMNSEDDGPRFQEQQQKKADQFNDEELKTFVRAMNDIQEVQMASNEKIKDAFSDSSMSEERFSSIYSARQQGESKKAEGETEVETEEFNELVNQIQTIQQDSQQKMVKIVREKGMTVEKFNSIVKALQSNPQLGERIQQFM